MLGAGIRRARVLDHEPAGGWGALLLELGLDRGCHPRKVFAWQGGKRSQPRLRAVAGERALILALLPVNVVHGAPPSSALESSLESLNEASAANGVETTATVIKGHVVTKR